MASPERDGDSRRTAATHWPIVRWPAPDLPITSRGREDAVVQHAVEGKTRRPDPDIVTAESLLRAEGYAPARAGDRPVGTERKAKARRAGSRLRDAGLVPRAAARCEPRDGAVGVLLEPDGHAATERSRRHACDGAVR